MRYIVTATPPYPAAPYDALQTDSLPEAARYVEALRLGGRATAHITDERTGMPVTRGDVRRALAEEARVGLTDLGRFAARAG